MARYRLCTTWTVSAPRERVAAVVRDWERWPEWWPGVREVRVLGGGRMLQRWRSPLGYPVAFVAVVERASDGLIEGRVEGALAGRGRCTLEEGPGGTRVAFAFDVEARSAWMRALAPVARRPFAWSHRRLMRRGGEGIARRLEARLVAFG